SPSPRCPVRLRLHRAIRALSGGKEGEAIRAVALDEETSALEALVEGAEGVPLDRPLARIGTLTVVVADAPVLAIGLAEEAAVAVNAIEGDAAQCAAQVAGGNAFARPNRTSQGRSHQRQGGAPPAARLLCR